MVEQIALGVLIVGATRLCYTMIANDRATSKLTDSSEAARNYLDKQGAVLTEISYCDCAPCEVKYSVLPGAREGLSSRIFLQHLKRAMLDDSGLEFAKLKAQCTQREQSYLIRERRRKSLI